MTLLPGQRASRRKRGLWFERLMAIIATVNFLLVLLDVSYIPLRDFYLSRVPTFTHWYGAQFKGIAPERSTIAYLNQVTQLEDQLRSSGAEGLQSPETQGTLARLRNLSAEMIDENPFELIDKSGTLQRIKNKMRDRLDEESSKEAFREFWSQSHFEAAGWSQELAFFNEEIRPLLETNYYRDIGENGNFIDRFWIIDLWFVALFGAEFLIRTLYLSLRYKGTNWFDAMLWRWYDILLLLPFWRWLRIIPVTIRLNQARLVNLSPIQSKVVRGVLASVAIEMTEVVFIRLIDQLQTLIREGEVARALLQPETGRRYIDINGVDEVQAIAQRLASTLVYQVLPQVKPEFEALIIHTVSGAFDQSPVYRSMQSIPGVGRIPDQVLQRIASEVIDGLYSTLKDSLEDPAGGELIKNLTAKLADTFRAELRQEQSVEELQYLLVLLLEEIKINYIRRLSDEDLDDLMEKTYRVYEMTQMGNQPQPSTITVRKPLRKR